MKHFLHAFYLSSDKNGNDLTPNVSCLRILEWKVVKLYAGGEHQLIVTSYRSTLDETPKTFTHAWSLFPGNRFYIVENNPDEVQEPNGRIVWRWDEEVQDTHDGKSLNE